MSLTTVQLDKSVVKVLKKAKEYPRQTYNELIAKMIEIFKSVKMRNQYDEFLHKVQEHKMRELWANKEDEAWENVLTKEEIKETREKMIKSKTQQPQKIIIKSRRQKNREERTNA